MTRKDYVALAAALARANPGTQYSDGTPMPPTDAMRASWRYSVECIADTLVADNVRFDRERFLRACGVQS